MSVPAVPDKWVSALDEKKFAKVASFQLHYRKGSAQYTPLPMGGPVTCHDDGTISAPTLAAAPMTQREFLEEVYRLGNDHFLSDQARDGDHPEAADLKIVLLDGNDKKLGEASKRLSRGDAVRLFEDQGVLVEQVNESNNVLAQTVRSFAGHIVQITGVEQRGRDSHESIMCQQMREVAKAWQEINADREKLTLDLVQAGQATVRAEEEGKRLELERQLADDKGFLDTTLGQKLGEVLIVQFLPKALGLVDGLIATATTGLERRKLKSKAELTKLKHQLDAELATLAAGDRPGDRPAEK